MKKLSLDKFRIMKLNDLSKIKGGDPTDGGETGNEDGLVCVSTSARDVTRDEQLAHYPLTRCPD